MPLQPELLRRTQAALILFILSILSILLQTTKKTRHRALQPFFRSVRTCMSIARRRARDAKVRKDLNILRAVSVRLRSSRTLKSGEIRFSIDIKVLTDLKRFRCCNLLSTLHRDPLLGHGPKEGMPLHPEPLRCTQTALILFILSILFILLQTTKKTRHRALQPRFRSVRTCMSIARRTEKNPKVR